MAVSMQVEKLEELIAGTRKEIEKARSYERGTPVGRCLTRLLARGRRGVRAGHDGPCQGPYGCPRGWVFSYARGTHVQVEKLEELIAGTRKEIEKYRGQGQVPLPSAA